MLGQKTLSSSTENQSTPGESSCSEIAQTPPIVAERPLRTPFVSQPIVDRRHAQARAQQCAKELGATALTPIRESMCSTFRANDSVLRVGHFTSDPSTAQGLATMLSNAGFRVPDVIATWQQDETGLGVIAYEVVQETGQATDWREVGRIIRRLHTDIAPSEIPTGYPIATPTHLPWWNFGAILRALKQQRRAFTTTFNAARGRRARCRVDQHRGDNPERTHPRRYTPWKYLDERGRPSAHRLGSALDRITAVGSRST